MLHVKNNGRFSIVIWVQFELMKAFYNRENIVVTFIDKILGPSPSGISGNKIQKSRYNLSSQLGSA